MKNKFLLSFLLIFGFVLITVSSKQFDKEEFQQKSFLNKIKYLIFRFFDLIEQYTISFVMSLRVRHYDEPYDFFGCFIAGCCLRLLIVLSKILFKSFFNIKDEDYVYNEKDSAENLYIVIKKLNGFCDKLNLQINNKEDAKNINNININITPKGNSGLGKNDLMKLKKIEEDNKDINNKLGSLEETLKSIEENYNTEKSHNEDILKTIEACQKDIKDYFSNEKKDE